MKTKEKQRKTKGNIPVGAGGEAVILQGLPPPVAWALKRVPMSCGSSSGGRLGLGLYKALKGAIRPLRAL